MSLEPTMDRAALEKLRALGGVPLLTKMIDLFLENTPKRIAAAHGGEKSGDWYEVERAAHSLKSSAANLGLTDLQSLAREIEDLAERRQPEKVGPLLRELESRFPAVKVRLEEEKRAAHA